MGCLLSSQSPSEKLGDDWSENKLSNNLRPESIKVGVALIERYVNLSVNMVPGGDCGKSNAAGKSHLNVQIGTLRNSMRTSAVATALPWKAKVLTPFGSGVVTKVARRADGIAEVTLTKWTLANGAKVKLYSPSFLIRSHHRELSSMSSIVAVPTNSVPNPLGNKTI